MFNIILTFIFIVVISAIFLAIQLYKSLEKLKSLTKNFKNVSEKTDELIKNLEMEKQKINDILTAVGVGILVIDKQDKIVLFNKTFEDYASTKFSLNRNYILELREHILIEAIKKTKLQKDSRVRELFFGDKYFLCNIHFSNADDNIIVILNNITSLKKVEEIKKDFVANVSHELRTPISAIKGFVETMEDEQKYVPEYISVIKHNIERMTNIVNDLLFLSRMEGFNQEIVIEKINAQEIDEMIKSIVLPDKKDIKFSSEITIDYIDFDKNMLYTVITNLLSNAFKYTDKGEVKIKIWQENDRNKRFLSVKDTGIGIPTEFKDRIFERFFVVDKARSKKSGGTGLGLSIVKHILLLHKYEISVNSDKNGTEFLILM